MDGDAYKLPLVIGAVALEKWCLLEKSMDGDVCCICCREKTAEKTAALEKKRTFMATKQDDGKPRMIPHYLRLLNNAVLTISKELMLFSHNRNGSPLLGVARKEIRRALNCDEAR